MPTWIERFTRDNLIACQDATCYFRCAAGIAWVWLPGVF